MKVILQRVSESAVIIEDLEVASIKSGLLILLGVTNEDSKDDVEWLTNKIVNMRVFPDENGVMNNSILNSNGDIILVSQFTLYASTKKGNRPSYIKAARPDIAVPLYEKFKRQLEIDLGKPIQTGEFGADMKVQLVNDGPVTIVVDSKNRE